MSPLLQFILYQIDENVFLFDKKIRKQYIVYNYLSTMWQLLYPTPEELRWLGNGEFTKPTLKRDVVIQSSSNDLYQSDGLPESEEYFF